MHIRWILHVDMDAYYASIEQRDCDAYRKKPVVVGGLSPRGVVATASYEARAYGIHSAMPMEIAKRKCAQAIFLRPRIAYYKEITKQIHRIMERYSPYIEPLSLDEAFLDISGMDRHYQNPIEIGRAIKEEIKKETGLIASAGIGPNKFLAKLASDSQKPDGLVWIPYGKEKDVLAPLPIRRLWGVGSVLEEKLQRSGYRFIGDIAQADSADLALICGKSMARQLQELANGRDERPIEWERQVQSIGNEETFSQDLTDPEEIEAQWKRFSYLVAKRLRKARKVARTISIKVRYDTFQTVTRSQSIEIGTNQEEELYRLALGLYNTLSYRPIRLLGLTASHLQVEREQDTLFAPRKDKKREVTKLLDALQERFGESQVMKGLIWEAEKRGNKDE